MTVTNLISESPVSIGLYICGRMLDPGARLQISFPSALEVIDNLQPKLHSVDPKTKFNGTSESRLT